MSFFGTGNRTITSTGMTGSTAAMTTATLLAEIDCNSTMATIRAGGEPWQLTWIVGSGTTGVAFLCEQALSTGLDMSTAGRDQFTVFVSSGQSAQYVTKHNVLPGDRFRVRVESTVTGRGSAKIIGEPLA